MKSDQYYESARKRVKDKKKFRNSMASFVGVSFFLLAINMFTSPAYMWAFFPIAGMGLGVFLKGVKLYGPFSTNEPEKREIERELRKLKGDRYEPIPEEEKLDLDEKPSLKLKKLEKNWDEKDFV